MYSYLSRLALRVIALASEEVCYTMWAQKLLIQCYRWQEEGSLGGSSCFIHNSAAISSGIVTKLLSVLVYVMLLATTTKA